MEGTGRQRSRLCALGLALIALSCLGSNHALATEDIEITKDFRISRDFRAFNIKRSSKVFFDASKFVIYDGPSTMKDDRLQAEARSLLERTLILVPAKADSEYFMEIRIGDFVNYAIRNTERKPSTGFVIVSMCSYPMNNMIEDCQSLTFYFFATDSRSAILSKSLSMWLERVVTP